MPDVREAFDAVTAPPEPGARERQDRRQQRAARKRQLGALAVAGAIVVGIIVFALEGSRSDRDAPQIVDEPTVDTAPAAREDDTYLLAISDGTLTPFRSPLDGWSYRFSPDGSQVAFTALDASGEQQIYLMEADGAGMTELTGSGFSSEWAVDVDEPAWSPDGEWLVISGTDVHSGRRSLYFLSPRRHPQTRDHAPPRSGIGYIRQASEPIWSPDGRDIAFTATGDDGPRIQLARTTRYFGGKSITTTGPPRDLLGGASSFSWSPDGIRVVFVASDTRLVSIANADGTDVRAIADAPGANPSWSPDGAMIAYDDLSSGRIAIYEMVTGETSYLDVDACTQGWAGGSTILVTTECDR